MEILLELILEFLLQAFVEVMVEIGFHALAEPFQHKPKPVTAAFGYLLFGAIAGGLSVLVFSVHQVSPGVFRLVNLGITPLAVGVLMWTIGRWRERHGKPLLRIDRFFYGYLFALAFALMRFHFAN